MHTIAIANKDEPTVAGWTGDHQLTPKVIIIIIDLEGPSLSISVTFSSKQQQEYLMETLYFLNCISVTDQICQGRTEGIPHSSADSITLTCQGCDFLFSCQVSGNCADMSTCLYGGHLRGEYFTGLHTSWTRQTAHCS